MEMWPEHQLATFHQREALRRAHERRLVAAARPPRPGRSPWRTARARLAARAKLLTIHLRKA
jgi:hypothetical protein